MKITDYCDVLNLELLVTYYPNQGGRFCARIPHLEVKTDACLESLTGNDRTFRGAIERYVDHIRGKRVVISAFTVRRREYDVPESLEVGEL